MSNTLFLCFDAPLQSWGERAQWSERDTAPEPTKSGVVGLLACALGWTADEPIRSLSQSIHVGVRCDWTGSPAVLMDYHTVGGGYASPQLLTGEGKPKLSKGAPHTEPTRRYYLSDSVFFVAIQAAPERIEQLAAAVQSPVWPLFLGRKSCVPARPVYDGVGDYESLEQALSHHPSRMLRRKPSEARTRAVLECSADDDGSLRRRDVIAAPSLRVFATRYSCELWLKGVPEEDLFAGSESTVSSSRPSRL